jgi:hypothetical protein
MCDHEISEDLDYNLFECIVAFGEAVEEEI